MAMKIITLNLNGIRSAHSKGAFDWLREQNAEIILLQEVRALEHQLPDLRLPGYHAFWNPAEKPGYSGVGVLSKLEPKKVIKGIGSSEFDGEGRTLRLDFANFSAMSVYVPSGSSSENRQAAKMRFLADFHTHLTGLKKKSEFEKLAIEPEKFRLSARRSRLGRWTARVGIQRFIPRSRRTRGRFLFVVVEPWRRSRQQRWMAARLPILHTQNCGPSEPRQRLP
jgi:exodeoxyribonuclease III